MSPRGNLPLFLVLKAGSRPREQPHVFGYFIREVFKSLACIHRLPQIGGAIGGEMAEWFKAHAWKACVANPHRGFESLSLRQQNSWAGWP